MKKLITIGISLMLVFGVVMLTGCGSKEEKTTDLGNAKEGVITIGLDDTFAPMGFRDKKTQELIGFDIDLAKKVGEKMGLKVNFKPISWDSKDLELNSKKIDCIWNGMSVTDERKEKMALSNKYLSNTLVLVTLDSSDIQINSVDDMAKYKIGTQADSAALKNLQDNKDAAKYIKNVKQYKDYDEALAAMKAKRVDVLAIDRVLASYKQNNGVKIHELKHVVGEDSYTIGFRKDNTKLRDAVNKAIKELIDSGEAEKISKKWFGKNIVIFEEIK